MVITYIDAIIIPSAEEEEGLHKLKEVVEEPMKAGLKINWSKCRYLQKSVEFLGYEVAAEEIHP